MAATACHKSRCHTGTPTSSARTWPYGGRSDSRQRPRPPSAPACAPPVGPLPAHPASPRGGRVRPSARHAPTRGRQRTDRCRRTGDRAVRRTSRRSARRHRGAGRAPRTPRRGTGRRSVPGSHQRARLLRRRTRWPAPHRTRPRPTTPRPPQARIAVARRFARRRLPPPGTRAREWRRPSSPTDRLPPRPHREEPRAPGVPAATASSGVRHAPLTPQRARLP